MPVQYLSPSALVPDAPYHHVAVGTGTRQVHVAGQVAHMSDGRDVPPGLAAQVAQALRNVAQGLAAAGAGFKDVVRLTFYVTDWSPDQMEGFMAGVEMAAADTNLTLPMPPASLIGVAQLFEPGLRVEIEATALLD
ncbi:enamine deaminase RidA (YjgF/YER057c/UK114 family) [Arthrobacter stackebrandtii]|uniref:Enamine deaminase RidA (YjgF/YER057c/UK114 family) n=1 Tax=Arthrobacter stackebrandtii TaxID=272161 RepID=A0ABS4Z167_9MICC|nr:RidA family protein [Arthrobacter stackebrandtii]MBP2414796.1 enamine deaminase RidA (YjgF/YER057c/UK114 family) [Arthrobacter stackebrandtii]PYG99455.1 hypothetical protein CVV67_15175 [Arthrobacter stackebrandtii]